MPTIDLDALVSEERLPKVKLYGRELVVRPMTGAVAHRIASVQADDANSSGMFTVLLEVVGRAIPELTKKELEGLSVEQVMALVQLTRGQIADVEQMIAQQLQADPAGKAA